LRFRPGVFIGLEVIGKRQELDPQLFLEGGAGSVVLDLESTAWYFAR